MKKLYCLSLAAIASIAVSAADVKETPQTASRMTFSTPASVAEQSDQLCNVTIKFGLDGEDIEAAIINFYDSEGNVRGVRPGGMGASTTLPAGRYDALCLFECNTSKSRFPEQSTIWVVKENIDITDGAEVVFDVAEVKEPVKVRFVHADGSPVIINKTRRNENREYDIVEKGNVVSVLHRIVLFADGNKAYMSGGGSFSDHVIPGEYSNREFDPEPAFDIWINPLSDRFEMAVMRMLVNEDCVEIVGEALKEIKPMTLTNDNSNYFSATTSFVHTPAYELRSQEYDYPYEIMARVGLKEDGEYLLSAKTAGPAGHKVKICVDEANDPYRYGVRFGLIDRVDIRHIKEEIFPGYYYEYDEDYSASITSPWGFVENGKLLYAVGIFDPYRAGDEPDYPGAPAHAFESSKNLMSFGEGVPFTQFSMGATSNGGEIKPKISTHSVGMSGELRSSDNADIYMSILVDGKESLSDEINTIEKWEDTFDFAKSTPSTIEIKTWHENAKIDDIKGYTSMTSLMNFANGADSDFFPPVINSIQMHAPGGILSQSFGKAEHGEISIYAGDFNQVFGEELPNGSLDRHFEYADLKDIKIEYALHGTDNFAELPVEVQGEAHQTYGQLYTASLSSVKGENNNWYDLRISLTDDADNTHIQKIAPAFFIFSTSGINSIALDTESRYKVIGRTIVSDSDDFEVFNLSGSSVSPYNLQPGVYIVKSGSTNDKVIIK